jgi:hypothetical protein
LDGRSLPGQVPAVCTVWGDFNNDGWFDLVTTAEAGNNTFHLNLGNGQFLDATVASGLSWSRTSYGPTGGDYDNDGDLDLYVPNYEGRDILYANKGDGAFIPLDFSSPLTEG